MRNAISTLRQFGVDPIKFFQSIKALPWYFNQLVRFSILSKKLPSTVAPILLDYRDSAGSADGHYFWQDLICAKWINENGAKKHLDIGSRIDGFIAHLLSFRQVTVLDIRPLEGNKIDGLTYLQGDAQSNLDLHSGKFDSVSTLHSIEHFGLGRYGDSLQEDGHIQGLRNIAKCVENNGLLYLSFPIGFNKVEFNAQRILDPCEILASLVNFEIEKICIIPWKGEPKYIDSLSQIDLRIKGQVGLFQLRKTNVSTSD